MESYWIIFIALMVFSFIVQLMLESRFNKYSKVGIPLSGAEVSAKMLSDNGIDVKIQSVKGKLTDHYNPLDKTINLSENVYSMRSIAAAAVAAHETGHCLQHAKGYLPLKLRSALDRDVGASRRRAVYRGIPAPHLDRHRALCDDDSVRIHHPSGRD